MPAGPTQNGPVKHEAAFIRHLFAQNDQKVTDESGSRRGAGTIHPPDYLSTRKSIGASVDIH